MNTENKVIIMGNNKTQRKAFNINSNKSCTNNYILKFNNILKTLCPKLFGTRINKQVSGIDNTNDILWQIQF